MYSLKAIALSSLLTISVNAFATDVNTTPVDKVVLDSLMSCKLQNTHNVRDNDKYFDCVAKSLSSLSSYKDNVNSIRELKDILYAEKNVLVAFEQAREPNIRDIRTQSNIVIQLQHKIEDLKVDLFLKMYDDESLKDFFNICPSSPKVKLLVDTVEEVKAKKLIKPQSQNMQTNGVNIQELPQSEIVETNDTIETEDENRVDPVVIYSVEDQEINK